MSKSEELRHAPHAQTPPVESLESDLPPLEAKPEEAGVNAADEFTEAREEDRGKGKSSRLYLKLSGRLSELSRNRFFQKLKKLKGRPLVIGLSAVVIGIAVYLNWALFYQEDGAAAFPEKSGEIIGQSVYVDAADEDTEGYFAMSQITRRRARDEALEVLQLVIEDENALKEVKDQAFADANRMAAEIASEANIEALILAKGFEECVAVISNQNANIIVKSEGLLQNEIAQIKEIVYEQAGITPVNVKIIEKK